MVAVAIVVIAAMTVAAFVGTTAPAPLAVAIRWGLVGLLAAQVTGVWMLLHGLVLLDADADPVTWSMTTYGAAGQLSFAHAVPLRVIQVLVVLAWLLARSGLRLRRQTQLVALGVVGYGGLVGVALGGPAWGWRRLRCWTPPASATCWRRCCWRSRRSPPWPATVPKDGPCCRRQPRSPGAWRRNTANDGELTQRPRKGTEACGSG
jgi:hypothetical protein